MSNHYSKQLAVQGEGNDGEQANSRGVTLSEETNRVRRNSHVPAEQADGAVNALD